jgi:hypothetical protein
MRELDSFEWRRWSSLRVKPSAIYFRRRSVLILLALFGVGPLGGCVRNSECSRLVPAIFFIGTVESLEKCFLLVMAVLIDLRLG